MVELCDQCTWRPITAETLPRKGDETINATGYVTVVTKHSARWTFERWCRNRWLYFRPINPPDDLPGRRKPEAV